MAENIFSFEIPGHSSRREWVVYVFVATNILSKDRLFYVGKTGDTRAGCNPIISRVGNHFSYYIVLSVSSSILDKVRTYIATQEEHHKKKTFTEEYDEFIKANGLLPSS